MVDHPTLLLQPRPEVPAEHEVGGAVAVKVSDLVAPDPEAELAAAAVAGLDVGPGGDLFRYAFAWRSHRELSVPAELADAQWQLVLGPATEVMLARWRRTSPFRTGPSNPGRM